MIYFFIGLLVGWVIANLDDIRSNIKRIKCELGIHDYMNTSSYACGNVKEIQELHDFQKYLCRRCYHCNEEMPYSRYFFNLGIREKNAVPFRETEEK